MLSILVGCKNINNINENIAKKDSVKIIETSVKRRNDLGLGDLSYHIEKEFNITYKYIQRPD